MSPVTAAAAGLDDLAGIFQQYGSRLHRYCASRVGRSAAEDVVAEAFLLAHQHRDRYDPATGSPAAWLFGIATNLIRGGPRQSWPGCPAGSERCCCCSRWRNWSTRRSRTRWGFRSGRCDPP